MCKMHLIIFGLFIDNFFFHTDKDGKFLTLVENNNNNRGNNANENNPPDTSSLFTINYKLWKVIFIIFFSKFT